MAMRRNRQAHALLEKSGQLDAFKEAERLARAAARKGCKMQETDPLTEGPIKHRMAARKENSVVQKRFDEWRGKARVYKKDAVKMGLLLQSPESKALMKRLDDMGAYYLDLVKTELYRMNITMANQMLERIAGRANGITAERESAGLYNRLKKSEHLEAVSLVRSYAAAYRYYWTIARDLERGEIVKAARYYWLTIDMKKGKGIHAAEAVAEDEKTKTVFREFMKKTEEIAKIQPRAAA